MLVPTLLRTALLATSLSFPYGAFGLTYHGADISSLTVVESAGHTYKDTNGATGKMETILKAHGMNTARVRIWTSGQYSTSYGLALGKVRPHVYYT
jgi:arabinogalactan endo-1,4-beta-galactosidase